MLNTDFVKRPKSLKCSSCGDKTRGQLLSTGCISNKCDRCYNTSKLKEELANVPAGQAPRTAVKTARRRQRNKRS